MTSNNFKQGLNVGDYVGYCDTCGMPFWASTGTVLGQYTGNEGAWVCPICVDAIDYGLMPFKIEPEKPVPIARNNHYAANPQDVPNTIDPAALNFTTIDPMSINNPTTDSRLI